MISEKLKQVIFKELYHQLGKVEIIPYRGSIFFIHREDKYWYFEFEKSGRLWWRYDFFSDFFKLFSLGVEDYKKIISEWVEEVLNCKVLTTGKVTEWLDCGVEEVLNCKVTATDLSTNQNFCNVEEVLSHKVSTTSMFEIDNDNSVEEVLNCEVSTIHRAVGQLPGMVDEVLSHKVSTTIHRAIADTRLVEQVLSHTNK